MDFDWSHKMSVETFRISGKKLSVPAAADGWTFEKRPGGWVVATRPRSDGSIERKRLMVFESKGKLSFSVDGVLYHGAIEEKSRGGGASGGSEQDLIAQFPGKVRKILVAEGASVEEGTPLLLLEAMKMEFSVKAPFSGKIEKIRVIEGQQLVSGDRFLDLKPNSKKS
jgi:biotin carboxyl carrier protein